MHILKYMDFPYQIMGLAVDVLSGHGLDSSSTVNNVMDSSHNVKHGSDSVMYCQITGWTVHVLSDHGTDS